MDIFSVITLFGGLAFFLYGMNVMSQGLEKMAGSLLAETAASGQAINEAVSDTVRKSGIKSGYLEGSNVQVADEMVNLIVAQRAYEMNSKAIQASDEMLSQANQLRR